MGNAAIFWFPYENGTAEQLSLGERLSDVQIAFDSEYGAEPTLGGGLYGVATAPSFGVRVLWQDVSIGADTAIYAQLWSLQSHYQRGGLIYVVDDVEKIFLTMSASNDALKRGDTAITTRGNCVGAWGTLSLSSGDLLVIHGNSPDFQYEMVKMTSAAARRINLTSPYVRHQYSRAGSVIRYHRFWPCCRRPQGEGGQIITEDHGRLFTLDMPLVMDLQAMSLIAGAGVDAFKGTSRLAKPSPDAYYAENFGI